jgi:hypothetical protein
MSLTSFLKYKDVKEKFKQEFPMPKFNLSGDLLAAPKTNHYIRMGIAFDYLMRFYLKRINRNAITGVWVAEVACAYAIKLINDDKILKKIINILKDSKKIYSEYLKTGEMNDEVIKTCLLLAPLDLFRRGLFIDPYMGTTNPRDIEDLKDLIKLVNPKEFKSRKICMLNPTFGKASTLVGGADMDLLLDNTLIDIKTTKFLKLKRDYLNQLIGYYILFLIGGIDDAPPKAKVEFIGVYYSRHGLLYKIPIREVVGKCDLQKFILWFKKRAKQAEKDPEKLRKIMAAYDNLDAQLAEIRKHDG